MLSRIGCPLNLLWKPGKYPNKGTINIYNLHYFFKDYFLIYNVINLKIFCFEKYTLLRLQKTLSKP